MSFDELQQPCLVFGASSLERNRAEVFGGKDASRKSVDIHFGCISQRFRGQRTWRRDELDRPATDKNVFAFHHATAIPKIIKNRIESEKHRTRRSVKLDENINVESRDRF